MKLKFMAACAAFLALVALANPAEAKHTKRYNHLHSWFDANGNDPRPSRWCGWWMRQQLGVRDKSGNLARWWAGYGSPAHGPAVGAIVVWRHHVGLITGRTESGWIVKSGNDGHAVRERERSLRGAIAYRWPHGGGGNYNLPIARALPDRSGIGAAS